MTDAIYLSGEETEGLATIDEFVPAVQSGYHQRGEGAPAEPRTTLYPDDPAGKLTAYLAVLPETGAMGGYTYAAGFEARDAWFMTPLFDARTGEALALVDGSWMNPYKTGATGAVGIDALACEGATDLALIGCGRQARGQLLAAAAVRDLERVSVYSPTKANREAFAAEFNDRLDATVAAVATSAAAVDGADIVITATKSGEPVFDGDRLADGAHVTVMGQYHPERREVDAETVARAKYVPDLRARTTRDAGAFMLALEEGAIDEDHVHAELGEVVAGVAEGRTDDDEVTLFDSGGTAIETVAGAYLLYEKARERGLGTPIDLAPVSDYRPGP